MNNTNTTKGNQQGGPVTRLVAKEGQRNPAFPSAKKESEGEELVE